MKTNSMDFLGKKIEIVIDRQLGSKHSKYEDTAYEINYGYVPDTMSPDGKELDAYLLNLDIPVEKHIGKVIAVLHRLEDDDDKLIVSADDNDIDDEEIRQKTHFLEKYFESEIIRP